MRHAAVRFAFAALASLAMATSTNAATILIFGQSNSTEVVRSSNTGSNTTFNTGPGTSGTAITVGVDNFAGQTPPPGTTLLETFNFTSTSGVSGAFTQPGFTGNFSFVSPLRTEIAGTITNGTLTTLNGANGTTGSFLTGNVSYTLLGPGILAQLGLPLSLASPAPLPSGLVVGTLSIDLNNFNPNTVSSLNFLAQNAGQLTAFVVPEPGSVVMASLAVFTGLGCFGFRRLRASVA